MTDKERIERLEKLVLKLASALHRQNSEKNGGWGWPSFHKEMFDIQRVFVDEKDIPASVT